MVWQPLDFSPGASGQVVRAVPSSGTEPLVRRVTVAECDDPIVFQLPSPHGQPIEAWLLNDSDTTHSVLPGARDRFRRMDPDAPLAVAPGDAVVFWFLDATIAAPPRVWRFALIPGPPTFDPLDDEIE